MICPIVAVLVHILLESLAVKAGSRPSLSYFVGTHRYSWGNSFGAASTNY